jgi:hypothetical protein
MDTFDLTCQAMKDHYGDKFIQMRAISSVNDSGDTEVYYELSVLLKWEHRYLVFERDDDDRMFSIVMRKLREGLLLMVEASDLQKHLNVEVDIDILQSMLDDNELELLNAMIDANGLSSMCEEMVRGWGWAKLLSVDGKEVLIEKDKTYRLYRIA